MSIYETYSEFSWRTFSDASLQPGKATQEPCDLLTFFAVIQGLGIEVLPITWQAAKSCIGGGATGKTNQSQIDIETSFAFKCVADQQKLHASRDHIFRVLINEVIILSHSTVQNHSGIAELQGICWDIESDEDIWPCLVFEKSQYGDLQTFLGMPVGRRLSIAERLELCVDIGTALSDMHLNGTWFLILV